MIRSLVAYDLKSGFSVKPFLCRITNSFSCRIQLLLRIAIRPPPRTARDPWDSPPPRNCPVVFIRHVDRSSFDGFLPAVSSLPLSLHLYISRSKRVCQQIFLFFGKNFSELSLRLYREKEHSVLPRTAQMIRTLKWLSRKGVRGKPLFHPERAVSPAKSFRLPAPHRVGVEGVHFRFRGEHGHVHLIAHGA